MRHLYFRVHEASPVHTGDGIYIAPCDEKCSLSRKMFEHVSSSSKLGVFSWREWDDVKLLLECHVYDVILENPHDYGKSKE